MSLHKLTAGSGYDYLTRQVAAQDTTDRGHTSLATYYTEKGETPGRWVGSGLAGIAGIEAGEVVAAEHMQALFGSGHHPLAQQRRDELAADATDADVRAATRLGAPFKVYRGDVPPFQIEVARRMEQWNKTHGRTVRSKVPISVRAQIRTEVARECFRAEHGRDAQDPREIAATIARHSRPRTTAVAGYDLTFSPVKSVSALWAVADPSVAARIERAHNAAVTDALDFIEEQALYSRQGTGGARQVDVTGLVATAFTHRDSRAGDPDLHTHVAVANKVQTHDDDWLSIDGRVIYKATVTASETYNTALEGHLHDDLGVVFADAPRDDPRKRPVREIVGVDPRLNERWSQRRAAIDTRRAELAAQFQRDHGRPPTPVEAIQLAQQATLDTREAKHEPRALAEQRQAWRAEAEQVLGGPAGLADMLSDALSPAQVSRDAISAAWVNDTAQLVVGELEHRQATWQDWHVRSEVLRQVRKANVPPDQREAVVELIVDQVLRSESILLASDRDGIDEPDALRRRDGASVYHVAGSDRFTSARIEAAERRIIETAGRHDGRRVSPTIVDMALVESAANGVELNAGQAALVRDMATSGARVQLGLAAAGTGKTTAMSVLTRVWEDSGGTVLGLAPSAAAAAQLREQTGTRTDTLAKLIHALRTGDLSQLPSTIDSHTLVLVDEAGMADTPSLDRAIAYAVDQGASVRLIGDDQQLAAIGSGGILRDISNTHGALRLGELLRFNDPAEGAATLALRDGKREALGFYLDHNRINVGDLTTSTDDVFSNWHHDKEAGLNTIMLATKRDLVHELNARAREARIAAEGSLPIAEAALSDGNAASVGDVVITRRNERQLRLSATDYVKNGDRWTVTGVDGSELTVRHLESGLHITLPAPYVTQDTELGYACTVHTAQGVSADSAHALALGEEERRQLYTMMTRGKQANHLYLVVVGDGDEHNAIKPETIRPKTATDVLEDILARDNADKSATTIAREAGDPAHQLGAAIANYVDALYLAAGKLVGDERVAQIEYCAEMLVPGIDDEPAWPVLRAHLLLLETQGHAAAWDLAQAVGERDLDGVDDRAAILDWRLDPSGLRGAQPGPLPWIPSIPKQLADDPRWGTYLTRRAALVRDLATQVRNAAVNADTPTWVAGARPDDDLLQDVATWRAANTVDPSDRRPTGAPQLQKAAAAFQHHLDERIRHGRGPALAEWGPLVDQIIPRRDQFTTLLAERLAAVQRSGVNAAALLRAAAEEGALPDDHASAALWWRISRHLSPTVATTSTGTDTRLATEWSERLLDAVGAERAGAMEASTWWPTLVGSLDHAHQQGWSISELLDVFKSTDAADVDPAQAMIWKISLLSDPLDLDEHTPDPWDTGPPSTDPSPAHTLGLDPLARQREELEPLEPSRAERRRRADIAQSLEESPVEADRLLAANAAATDFYEARYPGSWAELHLRERFGENLAGDQRFRPGYAPAGWTTLIDHLRQRGFTDDELMAAGLAKTARTGKLIDTFRDRAVLPVISDGTVLGFVGRRNPDANDDKAGPKYLNTAATVVFTKGAQLYGISDQDLTDRAIPVLVEGPIDAIAVTLASGGTHVGVAPLGTSLTDEQARQLARSGVDPTVATDGDLAGQIAAQRDYWLLAQHGLNPQHATLGDGQDPASLLTDHGPEALRSALEDARPLAATLVDERLTSIDNPHDAAQEAAQIIAAGRPHQWQSAIGYAASKLGLGEPEISREVARAASQYNRDRRRFTDKRTDGIRDVRRRLESLKSAPPADHWAPLARAVDRRLTTQKDWTATAAMLQDLHTAGADVETIVKTEVAREPLGESPAKDLRYRLVGHLPDKSIPAAPPQSPEAPATRTQSQPTKLDGPNQPISPPR